MGWQDAPIISAPPKAAWESAPIVGTQPVAKPAPQVISPNSGFMMGLRDPIDGAAQILRRLVPEGVGNAVDKAGNFLADAGLPVARSDGVSGMDGLVRGVNESYESKRAAAAGGDAGYDFARLAGNAIGPANLVIPGVGGAATVGKFALAGAKAGAIGGTLQPVLTDGNFTEQKAMQAGIGAVGGAVLTPAISKALPSVTRGVQSVAERVFPRPQNGGIDISVTVKNAFTNAGINPAEVPEAIMQGVQRQAKQALDAGAKIDPTAMLRRAQFEAVGLTGDAAPTLGQATRDPMQFANEKNLSGVRIKTPQGEGNPLADRFQLQNQRLGEIFDQVGAKEATDRVTGGKIILDSLRQADAPVKKGVDEAYGAARDMAGGRAAELERETFSRTANEALDAGMWGRFVPSSIRGLLNDISEGKTPFNVDAAVQIDGILSSTQRRAAGAGDEAGASAIGVIREALSGTPLAKTPPSFGSQAADAAADAARTVQNGVDDVAFLEMGKAGMPDSIKPAGTGFTMPNSARVPPAGAAPVDEGAIARQAFDEARKAARSRFVTIEQTPALKAALDDAAPDKFVQRYIHNATVADLQAMKKVLENSPEALAQARAQVADHLKRAAFGANASGDTAFAADRYLKTLHSLGKQKLEVFFTPTEAVRLNLAGKVASDINAIPAGAKYGTNTSGSGAAVMNLLNKLAESPLMRQVPGARMVANQLGEIRTERSLNRALAPPQLEKTPRELSPETMRALKLVFPLGGLAGGTLGGQAAN